MIRLLAGALGVAWAFAGWANLPHLQQPSAAAAGTAIGGTIALAFVLGRRQAMATATATAIARAEAHAAALASSRSNAAAAVNLYLGGAVPVAGVNGRDAHAGLDAAPWIVGPKLEAVEQDCLDQMMEDAGETEMVSRT